MSKTFLQKAQTYFFHNVWKRYHFLTVEESFGYIDSLADQLDKDKYRPDVVLGICTGGIFPSSILAGRFHTELAYMDVDAYDVKIGNIHLDKVVGAYRLATLLRGGKRPPVTITEDVDPAVVRDKRVLVIDDDSYTGRTLDKVAESLREKSPLEVRTAVLYTHEGNERVDYAGEHYTKTELREMKLQHPWSKLSPYYSKTLVER